MPELSLHDVMIKVLATMGRDIPRGFVRVRESMVLDHGYTAEEARAWVTEHGGRVGFLGPTEHPVGLRADHHFGPRLKSGGVVYYLPVAVVNDRAS